MVSLTLIGPSAIGISSAGAAHKLERKDAALLAVLAMDGPTARDTLAALLWPDVPLKTANLSLRQRIFRLRRKVGHELVKTGLTLALADGVAANTDSANGAAGELLAGFAYADCPALADWVQLHRERRAHARRDALAQSAAAHEAAGELAAAIETALTLLADDPLSDHALRRLMRLHYLRGDRTAAIAAFERFEQHLKDELGARPDPETVALLGTVESGAGVPALAGQRTPVPASLLRPPRLVGRGAELAALGDAWAAGRVPLLLGEAGMGKTRLLAEFAQSVAGVLRVQARPGDAGVPFALLARWLRGVQQRIQLQPGGPHARELARVLPEWSSGPLASGEGQRLLLQSAVEWLLHQAAERQITQTLLDDLHFADEASLELLQSLLCSERMAAHQWCLAMRPADGPPAAAALQAALQEDQRLQTVTLQPLGLEAVQDLLASLALPGLDTAELAAPLLRHTGGNPLFLLETLKDMVLAGTTAGTRLPQPTTVGALIERRLRALSPAALALARVAAIAGVDFGIELAASVLGKAALELADAWSELQAAQVLHEAAFAHDLVLDSVARSVPAEIARHVHGAIAAYLMQQQAPAARIAAHSAAARQPAQAARFWAVAAESALAAARPSEALFFWRASEAAFREVGDARAAFDAMARAEGAALASLDADALRAWVEALISSAGAGHELARAQASAAVVANQLGDGSGAESHATAAMALAEAEGDTVLALNAARSLALAWSAQGRHADAAALLARQSRQVAGGLVAEDRASYFCDNALVLERADRREEALAAYERAIALAQSCGAVQVLENALSNAAVSSAFLGRLDHALGFQERALRVLQAGSEDSLTGAIDDQTYAALLIEQGRYKSALQILLPTEAQMRSSRAGVWQSMASEHTRLLWTLLGQRQRATQVMQQAVAALPEPDGLAARLMRLRHALDWGEPAEAHARAVREARSGRPLLQRSRLPMEITLARTLPASSSALRLLVIKDEALACQHLAYAQHARVRCIRALLDCGEPAHAALLADEALALLPSCHPFDLYLPRLWLDAAAAYAADGQPTRAQASLAAGRRWVEKAAAELPAEFRESFLHRNPVNRELLTRAAG